MSAQRTGHFGRAPGIGLGLVLMLALVPPMTAYAADPPLNDQFRNPQPLEMLPQTFEDVDIASATWEPGERWPCAPAGSTANTVWYTFTYDDIRDGAVQVDAPGALVTAFYLPSGSTIADLSTGYCKGSSNLLIPFYPNRTEYVQIASLDAAGPIDVTFSWVPVPPNDFLSAAQWVELDPAANTAMTEVDTRVASIERPAGSTQPEAYDIPRCFSGPFSFGRSVWYAFMADQDGVLTLDPSDSTFADVTITAHAGFPTGVASSVKCVRPRARLNLRVWAGTMYYFQVVDAVPSGGTLSGGGLLHLSWSLDAGPELALPDDIVVDALGPDGTPISYEATAVDAVDGPLPVTCDHPSGSIFPVGYTWVWCTATDRRGTVSNGFFTVHVRDSVPPVLTLPGDVTVEAMGPSGTWMSWAASAFDAVSGEAFVGCTPAPGSVFPIGRTTVTCYASDAAGNVVSGVFSITVEHTFGPMLTLPADLEVEAASPAGSSATWSVSAIDAVDGVAPVACDRESGSMFPLGTTTVTCASTDASGHTTSGSFQVIVRDTTAPTVTFGVHPDVYTVGDRVQIACGAADLVGVTGSTCPTVDTYGWELGLGVHSYTATATDAAGNVGTATTEFTVVATYQSMVDLTRAWVWKAGVAKDLVALLDAAAAAERRGQLKAEAGKLADYGAMVLAQAGKAITPEQATMLIGFSSGL